MDKSGLVMLYLECGWPIGRFEQNGQLVWSVLALAMPPKVGAYLVMMFWWLSKWQYFYKIALRLTEPVAAVKIEFRQMDPRGVERQSCCAFIYMLSFIWR